MLLQHSAELEASMWVGFLLIVLLDSVASHSLRGRGYRSVSLSTAKSRSRVHVVKVKLRLVGVLGLRKLWLQS